MPYTLSKHGDGAKILVVNKGDPIASEAAQVLFNPFKRQSLSNERNKAGMGAGAVYCQRSDGWARRKNSAQLQAVDARSDF